MKCGAFKTDTRENLDKLLKELDGKRVAGETGAEELETKYLKLLEDHRSPEERGKIYAQIAFTYSQSGMKQPEKTIRYCQQALQYPLEVDVACQLYIFWADALQVKRHDSIGPEFADARREIIQPCLNGLKLVLDNLTATTAQPVPPVGKYDYGGPTTDPAYQKLVDKHSEESSARKKAMLQNKLLRFREVLTSKCISLYSHEPYTRDELKQQVSKTLKNDKIVEEIVVEVERRISEKGHPA